MATSPIEIRYAIYPGSITRYDGVVDTYTAAELAGLYGVDEESYLTINSHADVPTGEDYFNYIHLKLRKDGIYQDIKVTAQDDGESTTWERNFDGTKKWIQETNYDTIDNRYDLGDN
jgi:hypothetical protein